MNLEELEFDLPSNLIALEPKFPRDESKLVVLENQPEIIKFKNILNLLKANDVLVINNTKVLNSDLLGLVNHKKVFLNLNKINNKKNNEWLVFIKSKKKIKCGEIISFDSGLKCKVIKINCEHYNKNYTVRFSLSHKKFIEYLNLNGNIPLPPYIKKKRERKLSDNKNYQTIFAEKFGAVAAPTASLHFTENLLKKLKKKKINIVALTLHVNGGTYIPIRSNNIKDHFMHYEEGFISKEAADKINFYRNRGGRIFAVGTTVLRLLESSKDENGKIKAFCGETNIFIKPGWNINTIDALITNFHTPKSTLLLLVYAIIGKERTQSLYNFAIKNKIRFFSYGDACLLWNKNE